MVAIHREIGLYRRTLWLTLQKNFVKLEMNSMQPLIAKELLSKGEFKPLQKNFAGREKLYLEAFAEEVVAETISLQIDTFAEELWGRDEREALKNIMKTPCRRTLGHAKITACMKMPLQKNFAAEMNSMKISLQKNFLFTED